MNSLRICKSVAKQCVKARALTMVNLLLIMACSGALSGPVNGQRASDIDDFGLAHSTCEVWTDWRSLCSRTGPAGAVTCRRDMQRPVARSAPFCVAEAGRPPGINRSTLTRTEKLSSDRFCMISHKVDNHESLQCAYEKSRPFNGYRLSAMLHPWCQGWARSDTGAQICQDSGNNPRIRKCNDPSMEKFESNVPLYCNIVSLPPWCNIAAGLGSGPPPKILGGEYLPIGSRLESFAVHSIYCQIRR